MDPITQQPGASGPDEGSAANDEAERASGDARLADPGAAKHAAPRSDVIAARAPATHSSAPAALAVPSRDVLEDIARRQDAKHEAMQAAKSQGQRDEEAAAAALIQRNYRGYRSRRELAGMGLDASTRWVEVRETMPALLLEAAVFPSTLSPFLSSCQCPDRTKCRSANGDLRAPQAIKEGQYRSTPQPRSELNLHSALEKCHATRLPPRTNPERARQAQPRRPFPRRIGRREGELEAHWRGGTACRRRRCE